MATPEYEAVPEITSEAVRAAAAMLRETLAVYGAKEDLITIGAYGRGTDARVDYAIDKFVPVRFFDYVQQKWTENQTPATQGLVNEIRRIIEEPVTTEELQDAKDYLTGSFVFAFETSGQIARFLVHAEVYKLGFDYVEKYPEYIKRVSIEDLSRVAKRYLDPDAYTLVVVGPIPENGNLSDGISKN